MAELQLGPFTLTAPIATGGMGTVWKAVHHGGAPVAVKVLTATAAREPAYVDAFRTEVRAVARLSHPNIVLVLDHGVVADEVAEASEGVLVAGSPYLVMELCDETLDTRTVTRWGQVLRIAASMLDGLAHAHARGVVHRDLKPRNVLLMGPDDERPGIKLTDFGLAWLNEGEAVDPNLSGAGTPAYMPPEQASKSWRDFGPHSDLYAMGCFVWKLVTGRSVFRGASRVVMLSHLGVDPPKFKPKMAVPAELEAWLRVLLAKEPRERYASAAHAAQVLLAMHSPSVGEAGEVAYDPETPTEISPFTRERLGLPLWTSGGNTLSGGAPPVPESWRRPRQDLLPPRLEGAGIGVYGLRAVPLVGRMTERDAIWRVLLDVSAENRPRWVGVRGPAGVGKSRLIEDLATRAVEVGAAVVFTSGGAPAEAPTALVSRMLEAHLRCTGLDRAKAVKRIARLLELKRSDPDVGHVVAATRGEADDEAEAAARYGAIARAMYKLARGRVVVLVVDDAQWAADALGLVAHMLNQPGAALLVTCHRDEALIDRPLERAALDDLGARTQGLEVDVGPLEPHEVVELLTDLLRLDHSLVSEVAERVQGSPAMAVQMVGDAVQRGLLAASPDGFKLRRGARLRLPDDLHGLWSSRVDDVLSGLSAQLETDLEIAAVLGMDVRFEEWNVACDGGGQPRYRERLGLVDGLLERGLAVDTERGWAFAHVGLRECLVRRATEAGRDADHHLACADVLEARYDQGEVGIAERFGRHLLAAGRPARAAEALLAGVAERRDLMGPRPALSLLVDCERSADLSGLEDVSDQCKVLRIGFLMTSGDLSAAEAAARVALERVGDQVSELAVDAYYKAGQVSWQLRDRDAAFSRVEAGLAVCEQVGRSPARFLSTLSALHGRDRDYKTALPVGERAVAAARASGDSRALAGVLWRQAVVRWMGGEDIEVVKENFIEVQELFRKAGTRRGLSVSLHSLSDIARTQGDLPEAERLVREGIALGERLGTATFIMELALADLLMLTGRTAEMATIATRVRRECLERGRLPYASWAGAHLLVRAAELGDWVTWNRLATPELIEQTRTATGSVGQALLAAGRAAAGHRETERARWALGHALAQFRHLELAEDIAEVEAALAELPV